MHPPTLAPKIRARWRGGCAPCAPWPASLFEVIFLVQQILIISCSYANRLQNREGDREGRGVEGREAMRGPMQLALFVAEVCGTLVQIEYIMLATMIGPHRALRGTVT